MLSHRRRRLRVKLLNPDVNCNEPNFCLLHGLRARRRTDRRGGRASPDVTQHQVPYMSHNCPGRAPRPGAGLVETQVRGPQKNPNKLSHRQILLDASSAIERLALATTERLFPATRMHSFFRPQHRCACMARPCRRLRPRPTRGLTSVRVYGLECPREDSAGTGSTGQERSSVEQATLFSPLR